jgi:hypothetical protein
MRRQISNHLKTRSQTIRTAVNAYNKAASELQPPRESIKYADVISLVFLAHFDLLHYSQSGNDIRKEPWADPATRVLTDKYFELNCAKEEIVRLNIEWRRVYAWLVDERKLYLATVDYLSKTEDKLLCELLRARWKEVEQVHRVTWRWLLRTKGLPYFSANTTRGHAVDKVVPNPELLQCPQLDTVEEGNNTSMANTSGGEEEQDDVDDDEEVPSFSVGLDGCMDESEHFDALLGTIGVMGS